MHASDKGHRPRRPFLLKLAIVYFVFSGFIGLLFTAIAASEIVADVGGTLHLANQPVAPAQFWPRVLPFILILVGVQFAVGAGLVLERSWARRFAVWHPLLIVAVGPLLLPPTHAVPVLQRAALFALIYCPVSWLYMYRRPSVVEYYSR